GGVRVVPGDDLACTLGKGGGRDEVRNERLDLAVVEDHGVGTVAQVAGTHLRVGRGNRIRGHVNDIRRDGERCAEVAGDLVPGVHLIRGDLEGVADGLRVTEEA